MARAARRCGGCSSWDAPAWSRAAARERLEKGARQTIRVGVGPVGIRWVAEIADLQAERTFFVDRQVSGPFKSWNHRHEVSADGASTSTLADRIEYALPAGPLGQLFGGRAVRSKLERMFAWRHRVMVHDLRAHARAAETGFTGRRIAITGASGLIGRTLAAFLRTGGHEVLELGAARARRTSAGIRGDRGRAPGLDGTSTRWWSIGLLDRREEAPHRGQPRGGDARDRRRDQRNGAAARGAGVRVGDRDVRGPRRRGPHGVLRAGGRFPRGDVSGVGGRDRLAS